MGKKRNRGNGAGSIYKRKPTGPWYISYFNHKGERQTQSSGTTDKATAQRILNEKLAEVALRREGLIDTRQEALVVHGTKPLTEHLDDFRAALVARNRTAGHIADTTMFIRDVCEVAEFGSLSEITADGVNKVLADMQAKGKAARTIQARVIACKAFTKWLVDHGKLAQDPLRTIKAPSVKTDRRRRRRMLLPAEWQHLRSAALTNGNHHCMSPLDRATLYALAIQTGLRQNELRSLTKADLFLSGKKPYVRCKAEHTKNGNEARQYVDAALTAELRQLAATKTPATALFSLPEETSVAEMLRADLAAARKQWLDEVKHDAEVRAQREESDFLMPTNHEGETLDFHALRHTCGSWLALQGMHPNIIKEVMRHSSIVITMDVYGHLLPDQHADAVSGLASMMTPNTPLAATGTVSAVETAVATRSGADACGLVPKNRESSEEADTLKFQQNSMKTVVKHCVNASEHEPQADDAQADIVSPGKVMGVNHVR